MELKEALAVVLALLFPPAVYCLVLSFLNRRRRPVVVSGPLDFLGVLLALAGFLVVGGPAVLSNVATNWHVRGRLAPYWVVLLVALLGVYAVVVLVGAGVLLWRGRGLTSVYNVDPAVFDEVLGQALDGLGYSWTRSGSRFYLRAGSLAPAGKLPAEGEAPACDGSNTVIEAEPSPGLLHVTVQWGQAAPAVRREVEGELVRGLSQVRTGYNPAAGWFLSVASVLFLLLFAVLLLLMVSDVLWRQ